MTRDLVSALIVFFGAGLGGVLRHIVNRLLPAVGVAQFPVATLAINVVGSLAMGLLAGLFAYRSGAGQGLRLFLTTGMLGGFTTFSAFSLDAALLWQRGQGGWAAVYVAGTVGLSLVGVMTGLAAMRALAA